MLSPWLSGRFRSVAEFDSGQPAAPDTPAERHCPRNQVSREHARLQTAFDVGVFSPRWHCPRHQCPGAPLFSEDLDYVAAHKGMEYAPVLFPGFSWTNMHRNRTSKIPPAPRFAYPEGGVFNIVPRMGGRFWL